MPAILAVILLWPATLGGKVLSAGDIPLFSPPFAPRAAESAPRNPLQFDAANVFEPDGLLVRKALRDGRLPVWTPAVGGGRPLLAEQQSAPLFPVNWLGVVLPYWHALAWIAALKLALAALGTYLLTRALSVGRGPALLGAVAFGFGTYEVVWLMHPHINAYIVLPWLILLAERLCRSGSLADAAGLGGALGVAILGGQPESSLLVALATASWIVHRLSTAHLSRRELLGRTALAAGAGVLGVSIGAVMIVPFIEALRQSYDTSRAVPPLPVKSLLTAFFPEYWGRPDRAGVSSGPANFTERTLYVGAVPTLLAAAGLFARRPRGPQLFFAALAAATLVLAVDNPAGELVRRLPLLDQANLNRALVLASFAISVLAAFGCERLLSANARERRRMLAASIVVAAVPAAAAISLPLGELAHGLKHLVGGGALVTTDATAAASIVRWVVFAAVAVVLLAALSRVHDPARVAALMSAAIALAALDLLVMGWGYSPAIAEREASPPTPAPVMAMRRLTAAGGTVVGIQALQPNNASRWGLRDARGHELPVVARSQRLWLALGGGIESASIGVAPQDPRTPKLLDVFGVDAALLPASVRPALAAPLRGARVAYAGPGGLVIENAAALPPAFIAYHWARSPGPSTSLRLMASRTARQARDDPVIETAAPPPPANGRPATAARVAQRSDTSITLDVHALAPGRLVLLDTYYPGWHAQVDGREVPIEPANVAFDAVAVPVGRHRVHFYYRPASVTIGAGISLIAIALTLTLLLVGVLRRSRATP